ncbi:hypothetical protein BGX24_007123, partial [Mortierella sp. AD032]
FYIYDAIENDHSGFKKLSENNKEFREMSETMFNELSSDKEMLDEEIKKMMATPTISINAPLTTAPLAAAPTY